MPPARVTGILLAAGAGRRAGGPKALRHDPDGTSWLLRSIRVLLEGGCDSVVTVLGAGAEEARGLLSQDRAARAWKAAGSLRVVQTPEWDIGMSRSLSAGLAAAARLDPVAVLVQLVDLPDVSAAVVRRVLQSGPAPMGLARACYEGQPGHPVLIGIGHLEALLASLATAPAGALDSGARQFLSTRSPLLIECADLSSGQDRDEF